MRIFIVHGYSASVDDHWFPWLAEQLEAAGHRVSIVELPTPTAPVRREWDACLAEQIGHVTPDTVLVTHSLGTITALRFLATLRTDWRLGGLVAVSGFLGTLDSLPDLDDYLSDSLDIAALVPHITARTMIVSDDDAIVPPAASRALATALSAETIVVPGGGHFVADEGFTKLPEALTAVERIARAEPSRRHGSGQASRLGPMSKRLGSGPMRTRA
ncbi:alpha/beta hydrolase [Nocardia sp. CDC159]|uniref:Alpha/beta hydrolase n=1 Tax=Nocardia pulmonis TaxID=2951408 RepID=A0A9X2IXV5_9NOCA|nr:MULTISPECIES: alpha/beta hydrolase [Nocardia]MCM6774280.1 alpha/beta hydrolase [Nocardia pulmonis]MCM6787167.1 alpha/beta hydrolase [Nocardia sp. CDC159]